MGVRNEYILWPTISRKDLKGIPNSSSCSIARHIMTGKYEYLSRTSNDFNHLKINTNISRIEEDVDHFMERGFIVIKGAFTKEKCDEWTKDLWVRLALDPGDKSTWTKERIHMPDLNRESVETFAPKVFFVVLCDPYRCLKVIAMDARLGRL